MRESNKPELWYLIYVKLINNFLNSIIQNLSADTWTDIRMHYDSLCELLELIDIHLGPVVVVSCGHNLYFICYQLANIFESVLTF